MMLGMGRIPKHWYTNILPKRVYADCPQSSQEPPRATKSHQEPARATRQLFDLCFSDSTTLIILTGAGLRIDMCNGSAVASATNRNRNKNKMDRHQEIYGYWPIATQSHTSLLWRMSFWALNVHSLPQCSFGSRQPQNGCHMRWQWKQRLNG